MSAINWDAHVVSWRAFLATVTITGPIPIMFRILRDACGVWILQSWMHVAHREDGLALDVGIQNALPGPDDPTPREVVIRQRVLGHYQHEALEHILVGGERAFDPHAGRWGSMLLADWRFNR